MDKEMKEIVESFVLLFLGGVLALAMLRWFV